MTADLPEVVCICGSTRFRAEMVEANRRLTMAGAVVVAPGVFGHDGDPLTDEDKARLDVLHFRKIDMADRVVVVAPGEYIGESTRREIAYARETGKPVDVWDDFDHLATVQPDRDAIIHALFDQVPDDWDENDIGILADAVLAADPRRTVATVKAEALREAADDWWSRGDVPDRFGPWKWLNECARRIEAGEIR